MVLLRRACEQLFRCLGRSGISLNQRVYRRSSLWLRLTVMFLRHQGFIFMPLAAQKVGIVFKDSGTEIVEIAMNALAEFLEALSIVLPGSVRVLCVCAHRNEHCCRQD